jgi:hypothetical protein
MDSNFAHRHHLIDFIHLQLQESLPVLPRRVLQKGPYGIGIGIRGGRASALDYPSGMALQTDPEEQSRRSYGSHPMIDPLIAAFRRRVG